MLHNLKTRSGRRAPVFLKFGVKRTIYNLMSEHCRPTGALDDLNRPFAAYDADWSDQRVLMEIRRSNPEVTPAHVGGLRQEEIGYLESPLKTKIDTKKAYMAEIEFLKARGLELEARVDALEEWVTAHKTEENDDNI
jgi:hypothetical protein